MVIGDDRGSVFVIRFKRLLNKTHLNPKINRTGKSKFMMEELIRGGIKHVEVFHLKRIHGDAVRQVMYCPPLQLVFSCSKDEATSMFLGDFERRTEGSYLVVKRGINTFDYCKKLNVLITGGYDAVVRVWNPYITTKPVITLSGHKSPILHVLVNSTDENVISIAENKDIRIHDLTTQTCIQSLFRKMLPNMGSQPISVAMFNESRQALMFGWKSLILLQPKIKEVKELITSNQRVTVVIYNPIFHQVVTGGVDSQVAVWDVHTGEKVMQFKAHVAKRNSCLIDVEITAMAFGPRFRRLITGAQDGTIKIWNFNNGACLREIPVTNPTEITSIVCTKERIATAGWGKHVKIYLDDVDDDGYQLLLPAQRDDILTLAHYPPHLIASASHDGTILVWSLETTRLIFYTQAGKSGRAQSYTVLEHLLENTSNLNESHTCGQIVDESDAPKPACVYVGKMIFLPERIHSKDTAILFAACSDGNIRAYSVHHEGGLKGQFQAPKTSGCPVNALVADGKNNIIITGDNAGYIRVWDISHYCTAAQTCSPKSDQERVPYWKQFTYYNYQEEIANRRRTQGDTSIPNPAPVHRPDPARPGSTVHLINSFHAHLSQIDSLDYAQVHERDLLVSCSSDLSVRLWSINGEFLGIFGQPTVWTNIPSTECSPDTSKPPVTLSVPSTRHRLLPHDVRRVASATTLRVLYGGKHYNWQVAKHVLTWLSGMGNTHKTQSTHAPTAAEISASVESLDEASGPEGSILGKSYKQQMRHQPLPSLGKVSMYNTQVSGLLFCAVLLCG
jgi:WD40 repeat protein